MGRKPRQTHMPLQAGQLWRTSKGFLEIIKLGKTLAHYRHTRSVRQKGASMLLTQIATLTSIIEAGDAELVVRPKERIAARTGTPPAPSVKKRSKETTAPMK